jgi:hypothetical protein
LTGLEDDSLFNNGNVNRKKLVNASTNTIQELNGKLNDIINYSRDTYNFDVEEKSVGNLSNFLYFIKNNNTMS